MENDFDPDWPHGHVSGGGPARIVCTDAKGDYPIHALVPGEDGKERLFSYTRSGRYHKDMRSHVLDIRNAPAPKKRIKGWANIYPWGMSSRYDTKAEADESAGDGRIACIYIDVEEGEGL